jgi:hypothetical protein
LSSVSAFAATGSVVTQPAVPGATGLGVYIYGPAALDISSRLAEEGIRYSRDPFSGQFVQSGKGVRCIKVRQAMKPYCFILINHGSVL